MGNKKTVALAMALPVGAVLAVTCILNVGTDTAGAGAANAEPAQIKLAGKGQPPDGKYQCNKISGSSYINLGTLEIKGKTYRGFVAEGAFHPYTMDASGNITWTKGLEGMPDGWTLTTSNYAGPDETGKPLINIRYTSKRGAAEVIDAVRE